MRHELRTIVRYHLFLQTMHVRKREILRLFLRLLSTILRSSCHFQLKISLIEDIATWFFENKLLINPKKTKLLLIGTRQLLGKLLEEMAIIFLGEEITPTTNAKDLGLTLDSHLTYDYHIKNVVSSCMAKLCQINRVKDSFHGDTLPLIINALVMSKLYYCSTVWSNTSATNIKKLRAVQNFACRILTNTGRYDHLFFCSPVSMLFSQSDCFVCGPVFHDTDRSTGPLPIANLQ